MNISYYTFLFTILGVSLMNVSIRILFDFFDIKKEMYNEYLNWVNMIIFFILILPNERTTILKDILKNSQAIS